MGAVSAVVAAISARNSWRSERASEAALAETRRQRRADDIRRELGSLGAAHDEATLIRALATDLRNDLAAVERCRSALRRTMMVSGLTAGPLDDLLRSGRPLTPHEIGAVHDELFRMSAELRSELRDLTG